MWLLYLILSIQSIIVLVVLFLIVKKLYSISSTPQIHVHNEREDIEDSVKGGVKSAIKELEQEKEEEELLMKSIVGENQGMGVFSTNTDDEPINTKGDLIPTNLSDRDKEILRMFYNE
jgi:hypothetical protein